MEALLSSCLHGVDYGASGFQMSYLVYCKIYACKQGDNLYRSRVVKRDARMLGESTERRKHVSAAT